MSHSQMPRLGKVNIASCSPNQWMRRRRSHDARRYFIAEPESQRVQICSFPETVANVRVRRKRRPRRVESAGSRLGPLRASSQPIRAAIGYGDSSPKAEPNSKLSTKHMVAQPSSSTRYASSILQGGRLAGEDLRVRRHPGLKPQSGIPVGAKFASDLFEILLHVASGHNRTSPFGIQSFSGIGWPRPPA